MNIRSICWCSVAAGHDGRGQHPAWHLDLVTVRHLSSGRMTYFPCGAWIDGALCTLCATLTDPRAAAPATEAAGSTAKPLPALLDIPPAVELPPTRPSSPSPPIPPAPPVPPPPAESAYMVTVYTSDTRGAGTDCVAQLTVYGSVGDTGPQCLDNGKAGFERGSMEVCSFAAPDIGAMTKIRISIIDGGEQRPLSGVHCSLPG
jgi:PLAT/LH2 domain